jgi:PAS domain S-box-containing protein
VYDSDALTDHVLTSSPMAAIIAERSNGALLFANGSLLAMLGWDSPEPLAWPLSKLFARREDHSAMLAGNDAARGPVEATLRRTDGTHFATEITPVGITYRHRPALLIWIKETNGRSRSGEGQALDNAGTLRAFVENNPANIQMKDMQGRFLMVNPAFERLHAVSAEDIIGKTVEALQSTKLTHDVEEHDRDVMTRRTVITRERRDETPDGMVRYRAVTKFPVFSADGAMMGVGSIGHDITDQRNAENLLHDAIAIMSDGFALFDTDERLVLCNENYRRIFPGDDGSLVPGATYEDLLRIGAGTGAFPAAHGRVEDFVRERLHRFRHPFGPYEYRQDKDRWIRAEELKIANGGTVCIRSDITDRRRTVDTLREREAQLRLVMDSLPVMIAYFDSNERFAMINRTGSDWYNRPPGMVIGRHPGEILGDQYEKIRIPISRALQGHRTEFETTIDYADGQTRDIRIVYVPNTDADGRTNGVFAMIEDITLVNQTNERLRQSQKMEALGQVTGGVAHEFNNLLMAITGNLELLLETELHNMPKAAEDIRRVLESAFRGKDLTGRLLSYTGNPFSIPRQIDAGAVALQTVELLRPLLGETITIGFDTQPDLWPVRVDRSEFENAIINLALNSRDAMPDGGRLDIECLNVVLDDAFAESRSYPVRTGDHVRISVRDTGTGMPPEIARRAFDPFYTTKGVGKGTGLGLSMVYGFVHRQAGSYVDIDTEEGKGTTVSLYLPRSVAVEASESADPPGDVRTLAAPRRSALLVEDNADLRSLFVNILSSLNFDALPVDDAASAQDILDTLGPNGRLDLLLTDVVLPGSINGIDLATRTKEQHPDLKVILISGYSEADLLEKGLQRNRFPLLSKPFRRADLLTVLEEEFAAQEPVGAS